MILAVEYICSEYPPVVCTRPFGCPVVPDILGVERIFGIKRLGRAFGCGFRH